MLDTEYSENGIEGHFDFSDPGFSRYQLPSEDLRQRLERRGEKADARPLREAPAKPSEKPKPSQDDQAKAPEDKKPQSDEDKAKSDEDEKKPGFLRRHPLLAVGGVAAIAIAAAATYVWWDNASRYESTDDAFIAARQTALAPKITGYVASVPVTDNQHVNAGDVIAKIDPRDYQTALDQADAQVASAKAGIANAEAQIDTQRAQIEAAKANVTQADATLSFAKQQASRYTDLAKTGAGTVQNAQQYSSQLGQQDAALKSAEANEKVAERQLQSLQAQLQNARATLEVNEAQRDQALLNLSYTTVKADEPGRVVSLSAEPGELVQPGTALTMFVPDEIWIVANYKETQLDQMRPGQPVTFSIDAYPERELKGHVASVQPGSGTAFSLLPAQNATGNYVKVVQRVPVKIIIDNPPPDVALGPGMSVEPTVRVDASPSIWERMSGRYNDWRNHL